MTAVTLQTDRKIKEGYLVKLGLKTVFVMALIAGMVFSTCLVVQAKGTALTDTSQQAYEYAKKMSLDYTATVSVQNEYELLKSLQAESYDSLIAQGMTDSEIDALRGLDYASLIRARRRAYSDECLRGLGYTDQQIKTMNNFTGAEEEMLAVASTLYWVKSPWGREHGPSMSAFEMWFYWDWSNPPLVFLPGRHHMIGFLFTDGMLVNQTSNCTIRYRDVANGAHVYLPADFRQDPLNTIGFKFDAWIDTMGGGMPVGKWAQGGSGWFRLYKPEQVNAITVMTKYAASTYLAQNISITVGWPSLAFGPSAQELFYDLFNYSIQYDHYLP